MNILAPDEWMSLRLTAIVAILAVAIDLPVALLLGRILAIRNLPFKSLLETLVNLPLVLPPVVTGYLLLNALGKKSWIGHALSEWGWPVAFQLSGAVIAAAIVSLPLLVRATRIAFESIPPQLKIAARSLGASGWDAFWSITFPLARSAILSGCVLAFARAWGEFGATIVLAGNVPGRTQTLSILIYQLHESPEASGRVWFLVAVSIGIAFLSLLASEWLHRRLLTREGRI